MSSFNEQDKILNIFKNKFNEIFKENWNYQESVYQFNCLLKESKTLINNDFSEKLTLYFLRKMDNFITLKNLLFEEISKLDNNLKKLDIKFIIYINKLVDNLKDFSSEQRNIYKKINNNTIIKSIDNLLVNYYNKNKEIFRSIKQIHKVGYDLNIENKLGNTLNINFDNKTKGNINIYNKENFDSKKHETKNNIINYTPKFKFIMNNYIKSKSLKNLKNKINKHSNSKSFLIDNSFNFNSLFNDKIGNFIKKKLQSKNSSSPFLYNKKNSFIKKNNLNLNISTSFSNNKTNSSSKIINNKENKNFNNNSSLLKEINNLKEKNKELEKRITDLIIEEKIIKNNEINKLLENYNKLCEIYKIINEKNIINDFYKEDYFVDINDLKQKNLTKKNINEYIDNIYEKILESIEIKKNIFKEKKINNDSNNSIINSKNNNNNNNSYYIETIICKLKNLNEYLTNNINFNIKKNSDFNIITENNNLLSLSDEFETPKSNENINKDKENNNNKYKNILDLIDINEKLIKEKFEVYNIFKSEYLSDKNIGEKVDTNLIDNNININYSNNISFRNNKK